MRKKCLDGVWKLFYRKNSDIVAKSNSYTEEVLNDLGYDFIDATVPGNFELDFQKAGIIGDLFSGTEVLKLQQYEDLHLWYCIKFNVEDIENEKFFCFEGIDTVSDIYLNGKKIGHTDNMLIPHNIMADNLKRGENQLVVHIIPAYLESRKYEIDAGCFSNLPYNADSLHIRKAAHMYGWDIMPRIMSGGLWRSVYLCEQEKYRIKELYIYTACLNENKAALMAYFSMDLGEEISNKFQLKIKGKCGESEFIIVQKLWHCQGNIEFAIENPKLWWPKNTGEQNLYDVKAELFYEGKKVDEYTITLGVRTVTLKKSSVVDNDGNGEFCFYVNGKPIFVMGTNWVPLDPFHSKDLERLPKAFELVEDIGCNMIRCWGGNVYESEEFFNLCDEKGILVWQDFSMGCATYPQDDEFCLKLEKEVYAIAKLLRQHPSIALWAGDNECDMFAGIRDSVKVNPEGNRLTREIIPRVLKRVDPLREYLPSSPYIDDYAYKNGLGDSTPEQHLWGPRNYFKDEFYTDNNAVFASEIGTYCAPSPKSIEKFISKENLWPWHNDEWEVHSSSMDIGDSRGYFFRTPYMENQNNIMFSDEILDLDDFSLANQIFQAETMKYFIEIFRTQKWKKTGIIWWNIIDGWPQFSDAVVDYYFCKKLAYHFIKRTQQPVCLMMKESENGVLQLIGSNEYSSNKNIEYAVTDIITDSVVACGNAEIPQNNNIKIADIPYNAEKKAFYLIEWEFEGKKHRNHYLSGNPKYSLAEYIYWLKKCGMFEVEGFNKYN